MLLKGFVFMPLKAREIVSICELEEGLCYPNWEAYYYVPLHAGIELPFLKVPVMFAVSFCLKSLFGPATQYNFTLEVALQQQKKAAHFSVLILTPFL